MLVSLFTDASYCPDTKVGGYGVWAKCELGQVDGYGPMKRDVANSTVAEALAVYAGLQLIAQQGWLPRVTKILIQTDNTQVITYIANLGKRPRPLPKGDWLKNFVTALDQYSLYHDVRLTARHVRGHQRSSLATRFWVNNKTDKLAKKGLKEARAWHHSGRKNND